MQCVCAPKVQLFQRMTDRELWHSTHTTSHQDASYAGRSAGLVCNILLLLVFINPKEQERSFEGTYGGLALAVSCVHRLLLYKQLLLLRIFPLAILDKFRLYRTSIPVKCTPSL